MRSRRVRAVVVKELREYRRNANIIYALAILPLIFLVQPIIGVFATSSSRVGALQHEHALLYMLAIPVLTPAALASYSVVGERLQGTLEPVLSTPIRRDEFLLAKALAAFLPSVVIAYVVYGVFIAVVEIGRPSVAAGLVNPTDLVAQVVFTPLLAAWSIWVGIVVSARATDPRTAGQLAILASLPTVAVVVLIAFKVIPATRPLAIGAVALLVILIRLGWRLASAMFDRERLTTTVG